MSGTLVAPPQDVAGSAALDPTAHTRIQRLRRPALVVLVVLLAVVALAFGTSGKTGYLDPDAASPAGGRALRVLLEERGVTVAAVQTPQAAVSAAGAGVTLLVITPEDLSQRQLEVVSQSTADLVLVDPSPATLERLTPWLSTYAPAEPDARDPVCDLPAARRAGRAITGGVTFGGSAPAGGSLDLCYAVDGEATVGQTRTSGGRVITVIGSGEALTNESLAEQGDAALALDLLGQHPRLVWYVAKNVIDDADGTRPLSELLPPWIGPTVRQLCIAVLLLALWKGRRFGPVVEEPLPVVVRAAESAEGRARLYRRARARDRAAVNLRGAALARLLPLVGQSRTAEPGSVTAAVAERTGRSGPDVAALLYGAAPADDTALVQLANDLDALERMVRRP